jgi:hypothetical protein
VAVTLGYFLKMAHPLKGSNSCFGNAYLLMSLVSSVKSGYCTMTLVNVASGEVKTQ